MSVNVIDVEAAPLAASWSAFEGGRCGTRESTSGRASSSGCCRRAPSSSPDALGLDALPDDRVLERRLKGVAAARLPGARLARRAIISRWRSRQTKRGRGSPSSRDLLVDAVDGGGANGFLRPLEPAAATAYWEARLDDLAAGRSLLLGVLGEDDELVGIVVLDLAGQPNGQHRAEVTKLIVRSDARRRGLGSRLLAEAEQTGARPGPVAPRARHRAGKRCRPPLSPPWVERGRARAGFRLAARR